MNHISKIAIAVVAVALVIVIGLMVLSASTYKTVKIDATTQTVSEPTAEPTKAPEEEAQDNAQENGEMYEGALAGLTEEEIGKLAMAEEQHESDGTGEEDAAEVGAGEDAVAGIAD